MTTDKSKYFNFTWHSYDMLAITEILVVKTMKMYESGRVIIRSLLHVFILVPIHT